MERFISSLYKKYTEKRFINKEVFLIKKPKRLKKILKKAEFISRIPRRRVNLRNFEPIRKKNWRLKLRRNIHTLQKILNNFIQEMEKTLILRRKL